jgi:glyoxylase-like metal-dependent hydrolase (beta-lactamase superfamily II)
MNTTTEITARELWERLQGRSAQPFFVLDVRNEDEAARWRVEGSAPVTTVTVPYFEFIDDPEAALAKVPQDLGEAVVVCAKGGSSEFVADVMREAGRAAVNLQGGMVAWGDLHVPLRVQLEPADEGRFELWQFNRYGKGCLSYAVVSGGEAAIVDPSRFPELYEQFASERGLRIREVLETHVHADHISGGAELSRRTGARYRVLNAHGREPVLGVEITPFELDETRIQLGGDGGVAISARALRTPGHTPGSMSYLVDDKYLLSGDTLFVQGVGRPDLGGHVEEWGRALHRTLREVVAHLPASVTVLPAHFSSTAEAGSDGVVRGNLGHLRATAPEFAIESEREFVDAMKAGVREPPAIYGEIIKANLGLLDPGDQAGEWELGKNECAATAAARRAAA